jgi:ABC-type dipeptide/oligopeptide/nickel transport system ATPase component
VTALLEVRDLRVTYPGDRRAVDGVSFDIAPGETVALVGESGCGKTATALSIMRLLAPGARLGESSSVIFEGVEVLSLAHDAMRGLRGRRMAMVFQEPASALNPAMRIGDQIAEVALVHGEKSREAAMTRAIAMLERTGSRDAWDRARAYPHELSGGMRQRVMIAMALLLSPALLIADEPTSALDVTVQAQILALILELQRESGTAVLFITHDLGVVAEACSRAMVMRGGLIVESAPTDQMFRAPRHAYTAELLKAVPRLTVPA